MYFGCYHWAIPALLPEGIFCFFFFFPFFVSVSKKVEKMTVYLEKLWVGMEGPEKQNNNQKWLNWKTRVHSALLFLKSCRVVCAAGTVVGGSGSTWEVRNIGKGRALGLSPSDWAREWGFPKEERGKETVLDKVGGQSDEILVSREMVNLEPTVPPELEKGSPSRFPSSRTANAMNHVKTWHPIEMIGLRHFKAVLIYGKQVLNN